MSGDVRVTDEVDALTRIADHRVTLPLAAVLAGWKDGDEHGWTTEFDMLRSQQQGYLDVLATSIQETGIRLPILLGTDGRVWDGHHRLCVADILALDSVPVEFADATAVEVRSTDPAPAQPVPTLTATDFAAVLRDESVRRVDDRYVHHAPIRDQMRDMADRIERWERGEFKPVPAPEVSRGVAEVKAEALREAADAIFAIETDDFHRMDPRDVPRYLRTRADRLVRDALGGERGDGS